MQTARTTIELDRELLKKAKQKALQEDKTLKQIIGEVLEKGLEEKTVKINRKEKTVKIRTYLMGVRGTLSREEIYDWL